MDVRDEWAGTRPVAVTVVSDARRVWGSERSILNLAPALGERGIQLTVACPPGEFSASAHEQGLPVVTLELPERGGGPPGQLAALLHDGRTFPTAVYRILRAAKATRADVLHSNNLLLHPDVALAGRLSRRPAVLELHDIVTAPASRLVLSGAAALATAVVSISRATSAAVSGPGRSRVRLVPQAVDTDRFYPAAADHELRRALCNGSDSPTTLVGIVGRVDAEKGVHRLIEAVAAVGAGMTANDGVSVVVIGAPDQNGDDYLTQIRELGHSLLGDNFYYAGKIDDVPAALRCLDVLVNASHAEPFGLSILEAQACAVPVIATNAGGPPDFVADGRTGLLIAPDDTPALTAAVARMVHDPELRTELGSAAAAEVAQRYSLGARAEAFDRIYRSTLRAGGSRRKIGHPAH